jgi:branched-chain amino acid transport system permease protein
MEDFLNGYVLQVLVFVCINVILAMTIYMTLCTGLLSLGNAGFMSLGAYTSAILTTQYQVPMPVGILAGGVVAMLVSLVVGIPTTRLRGLYLAIATLGFGEVVRVIALNLDITHGALGYSGIPSMAGALSDYASDWGLLDALDMDSQTGGQLLMCIVLLLLTAFIVTFWYRLEHSRVGRSFAAIKSDEYAASLAGINVVYYKMVAFLFSSFFAGVAGALYAHATFFISPTDFTWHKVVDALLYTVFGGSNVMWGPVLGASILTIVPESLRALAEYRDIMYGCMLVVLMAFRPDGILSYDVMKRLHRNGRHDSDGQAASAEGGR